MRRPLFSLGVLMATLYWADCGYETPRAVSHRNHFFAGCYETTAARPDFDQIILVLEAPVESTETLGGCFQRRLGIDIETGAVAGVVLGADPATAEVRVTPPDPTPPAPPRSAYRLRVHRTPGDESQATTVTLINLGGAPFSVAVDMPRCSPQQNCDQLAISMPFLSDGGTP